jgi:hypothetical protein
MVEGSFGPTSGKARMVEIGYRAFSADSDYSATARLVEAVRAGVRHQEVQARAREEPRDLVGGRRDGLRDEAWVVLHHPWKGVLPILTHEVNLVVAAQLPRDPFPVARVVGVEQRGGGGGKPPPIRAS